MTTHQQETRIQLKVRHYATAGVALMGASAIAIAPVAPPTPDVLVADRAVQLSATIDPITPWLNVFNNAEVNVAALVDTWLEAPAPVVQQIIANQLRYLGELPDVGAILGQVVANAQAAAQTTLGSGVGTGALDPSHEAILTVLPDILPLPPALTPIIDFSTNYLSGFLLGLVGPVIAPVLALGASIEAIITNLTGAAPDLGAALNSLINIPAAMTDAFLNGGQTVDLTPLLTALGLDLNLGPDTPITVGITFGGLLSPGGSIFNALDFGFISGGTPFELAAGQGPGAIGSLIGLSQAIAKALGWDGTGNPLAPPLNPPQQTGQGEGPDAVPASALTAMKVTVPTAADGDLAADASPTDSAPTASEPVTDDTSDESILPAETSTGGDTSDDTSDNTVTPTQPVTDAEPVSTPAEQSDGDAASTATERATPTKTRNSRTTEAGVQRTPSASGAGTDDRPSGQDADTGR
jgi:hypothetical protein